MFIHIALKYEPAPKPPESVLDHEQVCGRWFKGDLSQCEVFGSELFQFFSCQITVSTEQSVPNISSSTDSAARYWCWAESTCGWAGWGRFETEASSRGKCAGIRCVFCSWSSEREGGSGRGSGTEAWRRLCGWCAAKTQGLLSIRWSKTGFGWSEAESVTALRTGAKPWE